jgi:hypothetical protein
MPSLAFEILISLNEKTIDALSRSGYSLYAFHVVACSDKAGLPLVWFKQATFSSTISLKWKDNYEAYTSSSKLNAGNPIRVGFTVPIQLGQLLKVRDGGIGDVTPGKIETGISILNTSKTEFVCGTSSTISNPAGQMCALPLYGGTMQIIAPLAQVFLMFTQQRYEPDTAVEVSTGPGMTVQVSDSETRDVTFDINKGWCWGNFAWGREIPANSDITHQIVRTSEALIAEAAKATREFREGLRPL